ncbi:hypothetical protein QTP88_023751 [Uroleucon formosanum]
MPKLNANIFNKYVKEYGEDAFATDGTMLYCKIYEVKVSAEKTFTVTQHIKTNKHERLLAHRNKPAENKQQFISQPPNKKSVFSHDLCKAMMCANIPLHKMSNIQFRSFLEKYTLNDIPSVSTLRKTYTNDCYLEAIDQIRKDVVGNKIWVSIDETIDVQGRYIANVIIGTLLKDRPGKIFLLNTEVLEKANFSTITKLFDSSMFLLWPDGVRHDDVLFLSDAAPYMKKAVLEKNCGFAIMLKILKILNGESSLMDGLPEDLTGNDLTFYKYAPVTSTDVERSFSRVLLNRADLIRLQYLEPSIIESIIQKEVYSTPLIQNQSEEFAMYLHEKCIQMESPPINLDEMTTFIKNAQDDRAIKSFPNLSSQIQMCAAKQLAESVLNKLQNDEMDSPTSPSYSPIDDNMQDDPPSYATLIQLEPIDHHDELWTSTEIFSLLSCDVNDGPDYFNHFKPISSPSFTKHRVPNKRSHLTFAEHPTPVRSVKR